jgi:hypothetical protein
MRSRFVLSEHRAGLRRSEDDRFQRGAGAEHGDPEIPPSWSERKRGRSLGFQPVVISVVIDTALASASRTAERDSAL